VEMTVVRLFRPFAVEQGRTNFCWKNGRLYPTTLTNRKNV
jgi:hypothetical protein